MTEKNYDIQELVGSSGVPRRTVYFYVQQGILPPPEGAGLAARYGEEHMLRLRLIPVLRQQGLRLDEIRERFSGMNAEEMRVVLEHAQQASPAEGTTRSMQQPPLAKAPGPVVGLPNLPVNAAGERFTHYRLPAGITLVVPEALSTTNRQRVHLLLQAAQKILSGADGPFYAMDTRDSEAGSDDERS